MGISQRDLPKQNQGKRAGVCFCLALDILLSYYITVPTGSKDAFPRSAVPVFRSMYDSAAFMDDIRHV